MNEEQQPYELRKEERQRQKEQERHAARSTRVIGRLRGYVIIAAVTVAVSYGIYFWAGSVAPKGEDFSRAVPSMGENHIAVGSALPEYNSNPPTSGPHYGQTAQSGFREEAIADQHIIHNLEHGDIWIAYHPRIADEIKEELKQFAAAKVIITPREANETDIALAAWGRLDTFNVENNGLPAQRINDFITRYINKGPEKVSGASGGV
ncbi:MAG: DUF3105 domain-containing protein [Candidatus Niyogibacteria bacterium]|nr:DUF3105 domain-containing protein [Candidatus Niyogibacteria bacterium]